jgi:hypothetical protein
MFRLNPFSQYAAFCGVANEKANPTGLNSKMQIHFFVSRDVYLKQIVSLISPSGLQPFSFRTLSRSTTHALFSVLF